MIFSRGGSWSHNITFFIWICFRLKSPYYIRTHALMLLAASVFGHVTLTPDGHFSFRAFRYGLSLRTRSTRPNVLDTDWLERFCTALSGVKYVSVFPSTNHQSNSESTHVCLLRAQCSVWFSAWFGCEFLCVRLLRWDGPTLLPVQSLHLQWELYQGRFVWFTQVLEIPSSNPVRVNLAQNRSHRITSSQRVAQVSRVLHHITGSAGPSEVNAMR